MLKKISIQNFKKVNARQDIELKPLTIICGRNSSGKSTILQSILLLKQSINTKGASPYALSLGGPYITRNCISDFFFRGGNNKCKETCFSFTIDDLSIEFAFGECNSSKEEFPITVVQKYIISNKKGETVISLSRERESEFYLFHSDIMKVEHFLAETPFKDDISKVKFTFNGLIPCIYYQIAPKRAMSFPVPLFLMGMKLTEGKHMGDVHGRLQSMLENLKYLGPVRAYPQPAYVQFFDMKTELESNGSNIAQLLWRLQEQRVSGFNGKNTFQELLNKYLNLLGINQAIKVSRREKIVYSIDVTLENNNSQTVSIADVGFGVSQVLPVILNGLLTSPQELCIFEQPEIHLHPECKGKLADLFLEFVNNERQVIVETHSTELIDNLRLRIIKDNSLKEKINIVFVEDNEEGNGAQIRVIDIDDDGVPIDWPKGFCDTAPAIARQMLIARNEKE